ncbi:unnamed protein product [Rhizophagus irregularis]|nr:unnamed protein product [Rhizophagus irregularis]
MSEKIEIQLGEQTLIILHPIIKFTIDLTRVEMDELYLKDQKSTELAIGESIKRGISDDDLQFSLENLEEFLEKWRVMG